MYAKLNPVYRAAKKRAPNVAAVLWLQLHPVYHRGPGIGQTHQIISHAEDRPPTSFPSPPPPLPCRVPALGEPWPPRVPSPPSPALRPLADGRHRRPSGTCDAADAL
jgi:hypothetical protein